MNNIQLRNSWDRIETLYGLKLISQNSGKILQWALSEIVQWRLKIYFYYGRQYEYLNPFLTKLNASNVITHFQQFAMSVEDLMQIKHIYYVLVPFQLAMQAYLAGSKTGLEFQLPISEDAGLGGDIAVRLFQYEEAIRHYWELLKVDKSHINALNSLGMLYGKLFKHELAIECLEKAITLANNISNIPPKEVSRSYRYLGKIWQKLGFPKKALNYYEKALTVVRAAYGENTLEVVTLLIDFSNAYRNDGNYKKALLCLEQVVNSNKDVNNAKQREIGYGLVELAILYRELDNPHKALRYLKRALAVNRKKYGNYHPKLVLIFNELGITYQVLGELEKALLYLSQSLSVSRVVYGEICLSSAIILTHLGKLFQALGLHERATEHLTRALDISCTINTISFSGLLLYNESEEILLTSLSTQSILTNGVHPVSSSSAFPKKICLPNAAQLSQSLPFFAKKVDKTNASIDTTEKSSIFSNVIKPSR